METRKIRGQDRSPHATRPPLKTILREVLSVIPHHRSPPINGELLGCGCPNLPSAKRMALGGARHPSLIHLPARDCADSDAVDTRSSISPSCSHCGFSCPMMTPSGVLVQSRRPVGA